MQVNLLSSEGELFVVDESVACRSGVIRTVLEGQIDGIMVILLSMLTGRRSKMWETKTPYHFSMSKPMSS